MILFNYILIYNTFYQREGRRNLGVPFFNENKNIYLKVEFNPLPVTKYHTKQTANLPSLYPRGMTYKGGWCEHLANTGRVD